MRNVSPLAIAVTLFLLFPVAVVAADTEGAAKAVSEAFDAELRGDLSDRNSKLERALAIDPSNVAARSMAGHMRDKHGWADVEELISRWSSDPVIVGYNRLRNQVQATPQGQLMLARYCAKHGLEERASFHWRLVLFAAPGSREAAKALGLKKHRGRLMTEDQIKRFETAREASKESGTHLRELVEAAEGDDDAEADRALAAIRELRGDHAVGSLFGIAMAKEEPVASAAADALAANETPRAAAFLARLALLTKNEDMARRAAEALKERHQSEYATILLGALATPIHVSGDLQQIDTRVVYSIRVRREGPLADYSNTILGTSRWTIGGNDGAAPGVEAATTRRALQIAPATYARIARRAAITNQHVHRNNQRVFAVLEIATDQQLERRPQAWWDWWAEQNDIYQPKYKPEYERYTRQDILMSCECFLAGTQVWTDRGKQRIERLRAGDRVLTCHPESGELSFRFILATTVRPADNTTRLRLNGEDIVSTDGHPMWVIGKGWEMAKNIKAGDRLRGVREPLTVEVVERGPEAEVYNLIVDGVNNYFVGDSGALAHDNTLRRPTRCDMPGHVAATE